MRDYCSDMIDVMTDLKNKSNTSKEKEKCALLIKKMQVFWRYMKCSLKNTSVKIARQQATRQK